MNNILSIILWITYFIALYFTIFWLLVFLDYKKPKKTSPLKKFSFVTVAIPAYNEQKTLRPTVESVLSLEYPKGKIEIIIINDGSKDNTQKIAEQIIKENPSSNIKLINKENSGKGAALNSALKIARGEFFACLDADSFVDSKTLKKMLKLYENEDQNLAIVTPAMKVKKPDTFFQKIQQLEYLISLFMARLMSYLDCIYVAPGPFSLYNTGIIKKIGGFDEHTLTEDQEIAYRVQKNHYKIKQCYNGYVYTIAPKNLRSLYKQRNRWFKGGFLNLLQYKKLMWNKEYGDFGIMQMNINMSLFFLSMATLFFFSFYFLKPFYDFIKNLYLINFDITTILHDLINFQFSILGLDIEKIAILYLLLAISLSIIYFSYKNANEKFEKKNIIALLSYFVIYYIIMSFVIVVIFFEILVYKKHRWER